MFNLAKNLLDAFFEKENEMKIDKIRTIRSKLD